MCLMNECKHKSFNGKAKCMQKGIGLAARAAPQLQGTKAWKGKVHKHECNSFLFKSPCNDPCAEMSI